MEDVPVKIVERYKPPPLVYQLPQTVANRLAQYHPNYFDGQAFQYDFQLERTVLSKCQHWRQMRHQQQQARHVRQEQRKQERQRALEAKQKEMLGAVEYPSAADLSSDSDDDETAAESSPTTPSPTTTTTTATSKSKSINATKSREQVEPKSINSCNNFHDILQPTILSGTTATPVVANHKRNSSLNYADFEYNMNSSPFDNIELKTINDLDILAQVLHQSQLTQNSQVSEEEEDQKTQPDEQPGEKQVDRVETEEAPVELELAVTTLAETKATLDSVNFQMHCDDGQNIPAMYPTTHNYNTPQQQQLNNYQHMVYNQHYYPQVSGQQQLYHNHNYLQHGYVNGYGTPTHLPAIPGSNNSPSTASILLNPQEVDTKSRSVPDILRELKTELQQAEKRRARLHSHNENEQQAMVLTLPQQESQAPPSNVNIFQELAEPAQKLAQRISSMGFPLERVAKVVNLCGVDDKKIIEHLIPLGELMDLGFEETKISAALLKFDNNKDKALDYLIK
ncbi:uncharacterized protein LOC117790737 [Drosophila innubila]|uniref:uncharacterized protein LOC117790737 n=1 Tax=Drosophila innubila TaxID=198719 RepID=UPI00148DA1A7|nr:uncharacterized protein LOC117790737 [Drosophila innubila]